MNLLQKFGIFALIVIIIMYIYLSFFKEKVDSQYFPSQQNEQLNNDDNTSEVTKNKKEHIVKTIKIFILDKDGKIRSVNRTCDTSLNTSCFEYAIKELLNAPSKWEKSKGFFSEIPSGTKIISVRENSNSIFIDLSSSFETGDGTESIYIRLKQLIRTAHANSSLPIYLYINGKRANVIGGEGLIIQQPLNEGSLNE